MSGRPGPNGSELRRTFVFLYPLRFQQESTFKGQVVSRFLSPEGLLVGVTFTPMMRESE
jgi:hypothetical protein